MPTPPMPPLAEIAVKAAGFRATDHYEGTIGDAGFAKRARSSRGDNGVVRCIAGEPQPGAVRQHSPRLSKEPDFELRFADQRGSAVRCPHIHRSRETRHA